MSVRIKAQIICDGCGTTTTEYEHDRTTDQFVAYEKAKEEARRNRWVTLTRYGRSKHYCQTCADKGLPAHHRQHPANIPPTERR